MRKHLRLTGFCLFVACVVHGSQRPPASAVMQALPAHEVAIILEAGRSYELEGEALQLLLVIRKIENGGPGMEMGVASDFPNHRSHRYAGQAAKSLRLQALWAAGTIRKHYTGDLEAFAKRYCPPKWDHWTHMARHWMNRN